ncbi:uncharacterized protein LOC144910346 [Branchiostoma floridae x Branchiostoma belcheri]
MSAQKKMIEAAFAAGTSGGGAPDGLAKVRLKVENAVDKNWTGTVDTVVLVPPGTSVYHMLLQACNERKIKFVASWDGQWWSHLIYSINGLCSNKHEKTYWSFMGGGEYVFDRGVDLISVYDGDVIKFRYVT